MNRNEFIRKVGATTIGLPICLRILSGCSNTDVVPAAPTSVDFTVDVSSGALSKNGGYILKSGIIIARTNTGDFIALSSACTHQGVTIQYVSGQNDFYCPGHGAMFNTSGMAIRGPASRSLVKYNTELTGSSLRIYS